MKLRRNTTTRRATGDLAGQIRYVLLDEYLEVVGKTTYPTKQAAESCRQHPAQEIRKCLVTGRGGPFSDTIEVFKACQCGTVNGSPCGWRGPPQWAATVEHMPEHLRASHQAARNRGVYPHNGAVRLHVSKECAEHICDDDWTFEVE